MTRRLLILLVTAALALSSVCVRTEEAVARDGAVPRAPAFVEKVNEAIDGGVGWLVKQQARNGRFQTRYGGYPASGTAIAYLTLRVCGVPRDEKLMQRAYRAMRQEYLDARDSDRLRTYTAALIMMAIEEQARNAVQASAKETRYKKDSERTTRLDEADLAWMRELVAFLEDNQSSHGGWSYGQKVSRYRKNDRARNSTSYDHSNTQYALLGLKAASRSGVEVNREVYAQTLEHLIKAQQRAGPEVPRVAFTGRYGTFAREKDQARGWGYGSLGGRTAVESGAGHGGAYGSMTAGSLGAVVICRSELIGWSEYSRRLDRAAEDAIWDGIAWIGKHFAVDTNPGKGGWHLYYLYALERAGVLAGVDWMGEHDWYGEGADYLVSTQRSTGAWGQDGDQLTSTCFALLFLKKGTIAVTRGAVTPSGAADNINFDAARLLRGKDLDDFVDLVISRWGRASAAADREKLRRGIASVGPKVILSLLRRMGTGSDRQRKPAHAVIAAITKQTFDFDPVATTEARFDALLTWEMWYMSRVDRLVYDERTGTLVTR